MTKIPEGAFKDEQGRIAVVVHGLPPNPTWEDVIRAVNGNGHALRDYMMQLLGLPVGMVLLSDTLTT